jgi:hypothetical protein
VESFKTARDMNADGHSQAHWGSKRDGGGKVAKQEIAIKLRTYATYLCQCKNVMGRSAAANRGTTSSFW